MSKENKPDSFQGTLGQYHWQETDDGSQTLYSDHFQEACHSTAGAYQETLHNYVEGCAVSERLEQVKDFTIFEVGFATGLGLRCTLDKLQNATIPFHFISCELDQVLVEQSLQQFPEFVGSMIEKEGLTYFQGACDRKKLTILIGDVRHTLPLARQQSLLPSFHAIYQDPFSPKKNPRLWTWQWFTLLRELSHEDVILGTYSSTKAVWKAMIKGGWRVYEIAGFGQKRLSTRAKLSGQTSPSVLAWCERSPTPALADHEDDK